MEKQQPAAAARDLSFTSRCVHADAGVEGRREGGDVAPPIHVSVTYELENESKLVYSRSDQVTRRRVEQMIGKLEGGHAVTFSSGLSAASALFVHLKPQVVYGHEKSGYFGIKEVLGTYRDFVALYSTDGSTIKVHDISQLQKHQAKEGDAKAMPSPRDGVAEEKKDADKKEGAEESNEPEKKGSKRAKKGSKIDKKDKEITIVAVYKPRTLIWIETPNNPTSALYDIAEYAKIAREMGAYLVVDSTFATPVLQQPLELGADFVLHSSTKGLGGHSDLLGGVVVCKDESHWGTLKRQRSIIGNVMGSLETWLLLRSLRTLSMRVKKQSKNATKVAAWLEKQRKKKHFVTKVWYPSLKSSPDHQLLQKQMTKGRGPGILSFELDTAEHAKLFAVSLDMIVNAVSLGGCETLIDYRHRWDSFVTPTLLRLSLGLESSKDLIADLELGLKRLEEHDAKPKEEPKEKESSEEEPAKGKAKGKKKGQEEAAGSGEDDEEDKKPAKKPKKKKKATGSKVKKGDD